MSSARSDQNLSALSGSIYSIPPPRGGNLVTFDQPLLGYSSRVRKSLCPGPPASSSCCKRRKLEGSSIPDVSATCSPRAEATSSPRALVPQPSTATAASSPRPLVPLPSTTPTAPPTRVRPSLSTAATIQAASSPRAVLPLHSIAVSSRTPPPQSLTTRTACLSTKARIPKSSRNQSAPSVRRQEIAQQ